jgi:hypothetical protein
VLDTLNRSLAGSESDDEDMAAYVKAADAIREAFGCAVVIATVGQPLPCPVTWVRQPPLRRTT